MLVKELNSFDRKTKRGAFGLNCRIFSTNHILRNFKNLEFQQIKIRCYWEPKINISTMEQMEYSLRMSKSKKNHSYQYFIYVISYSPVSNGYALPVLKFS